MKNRLNNLSITFPYWVFSILLVWVIRIFEYYDFQGLMRPYSTEFLLVGLLQDLTFHLFIIGLALFIQFVLNTIMNKNSSLIFHMVLWIGLILQFALSQYFILLQVPLDHSFFTLSFNDLSAIIDVKNYLNPSIILCLLLVLTVYLYWGRMFEKFKKPTWLLIFPLLGIVGMPLIFQQSNNNPNKRFCANNHLNYFIQTSYDYFVKENNYNNNNKSFNVKKLDERFFPFEGIDKDYPLLHLMDQSSDFKSQFNLKPNNPPHIVLIIVESLNSYFLSDDPNEKIDIMPFLKGLSKKSLFFPNTISTSERTLNVLPSTLNSLPIAPDQISATSINPMPFQYSLQALLKGSYYSRFYCGVDLSFTNMNGFMNYNQTDYMVQKWDNKFEKINNEYYNDQAIFEQSWLDIKKVCKKNRLDVFLTFSTHEPFLVPNSKSYSDKVINWIRKSKIYEYRKKFILKNVHKYGSYSYLDDQLKNYFNEATKRREHKNTIYFIVGDHGSELCYFEPISRFHTSLIVYSELLKKPKTSKAVVSHLDIPPSIIHLLSEYKDLNLPEKVPFAGKVLELKDDYKSNRILPLKANNLSLSSIIFGDYLFDQGELFKLDKHLNARPIKNKKTKTKIENQLRIYNDFSGYLFTKNKILPEYLAQKHLKHKYLVPFFEIQNDIEKELETSQEFISIPHYNKFPLNYKILKVWVEIELQTSNKIDQNNLPTLVCSFIDQSIKENNLLFYHGSKPKIIVGKNNRMKLQYEVQIQKSSVKKGKQPVFEYYLYNPKRINLNLLSEKIILKSDVSILK